MSIDTLKAAAAALTIAAVLTASPWLSAQTGADGDKDGVADTADDCPYTPTGAKVDRTGCALDEDFDGVADGLDRCNATPLGAVVDGEGCAKEQAATGTPAAPPAPLAPPPIIVTTPPPSSAPPAAGVDPFSTAPPAPSTPIQAYPLGSAPTPAQVNSGAVAVPAPAPFPTVPDQVRTELDARASSSTSSGKTIINLPVLRNPNEIPTAPLPPVASEPVAPIPPWPDVSGAAAVVEPPPPPPVVEVRQAYLFQRPVLIAPPALSGAPVLPTPPKPVIPPAPSFNPPVPFSGGAPVDPFATPVLPTSSQGEWTTTIGDGGQISGVAEQELRIAADAIKQAQRENPSLNYEVAGSVNAASNAMSFLVTQGVPISRLRLKATAATDGKVLIRPASE